MNDDIASPGLLSLAAVNAVNCGGGLIGGGTFIWPPTPPPLPDTAETLTAKLKARLSEVRSKLAEVPALQREEKQLEAMLAAVEEK